MRLQPFALDCTCFSMASSCGAPGGCGFAYAIVHCGGAVHLGVRSLRGSWGAWLLLPRVAASTLDTLFYFSRIDRSDPLTYKSTIHACGLIHVSYRLIEAVFNAKCKYCTSVFFCCSLPLDKDVFLWRLLVGPLGVVASRTQLCTAGGQCTLAYDRCVGLGELGSLCPGWGSPHWTRALSTRFSAQVRDLRQYGFCFVIWSVYAGTATSCSCMLTHTQLAHKIQSFFISTSSTSST